MCLMCLFTFTIICLAFMTHFEGCKQYCDYQNIIYHCNSMNLESYGINNALLMMTLNYCFNSLKIT